MDAWTATATQWCQLLGISEGMLVSVACAVLLALILVAIGLGFGPLRGWLSEGSLGKTHLPGSGLGDGRERPGVFDGGLLSTWRLYREFRRPATRGTTLGMPRG